MDILPFNHPRRGVVVGVGHKFFSGKDTFARRLVEAHGFTRIAFADTLKEACKVVFGFTDAQVYGDQKTVVDPYWDQRLRVGRTPSPLRGD